MNGNGRWINGSTVVSLVGSIIASVLVVGVTYGSLKSQVDFHADQLVRLEAANGRHTDATRETAVAMATLATQLAESKGLITDLRAEIKDLRTEIKDVRDLLYRTRREAAAP